ncbi:phosphotransferase [Desulfovibrio sulfodismutans]|uniref:Phosphotransferase n=1 Tax=Desulfolutivibrio sulfodismutans TaxID=63561 RepID=A0A7K3NPU7_9BACT|nr:phosphotransferase [Desulfolutivibrio sulfodismutans]NDY57825.1 phosphotransferase [Desulfolutivibrio sulfodismutans]QLA11593.1 phosphotransferase [Desulfolutivibrio sulfodismutans DSM 3696]
MSDPLRPFGLVFRRDRPDLPIPGSPERCLSRRVVEDSAGSLYLLESLAASQLAHRQTVAACTAALARAGLTSVAAHLPCLDGGFVASKNRLHIQLSRFAPGVPLPRPDYTLRPEPGQALGRFITDLRDCAARADLPPQLPNRSLADYATTLMRTLAAAEPAVFSRLAPLATAMGAFLDAEPSLPRALCHGDLHPENAIWDGFDLVAAIDWEFVGMAHELYDVAGALGCMGIENPRTFAAGAGAAMIRALRDRGLLNEDNLRWLRPAVMAGRLGWLAEWLRKNDREMVEMELDYLELLAR